MNKIQIMILGNNEMEVATIKQQLQDTTVWQVNAVTDKEDAINLFQNIGQDVVIFADSVETATKNGLERIFRFQQEDVIILTVTNETDIWDKVNNALHDQADNKRPSYSFVDDALKNARFNITLN